MHPIQILKACLPKSGWALALLLASSISALAAPPDLTTGGVPSSTVTTNLGPTGLRGWVYHVTIDSGESRQIQVQAVDAGSPAAGKLAVNDVILGANGTGANPVNFTADARRSFADAINDAEARTPAELKVLRWRAGTTTTQTLTLRNMGAYSATAPYNCPKSAKILEEGLQAIMTTGETAGAYSFGTLTLLAGNNPANPNNAARQARAQTEARALIPDAARMAKLTSGEPDLETFVPWRDGHEILVLTEYYLRTNDALVLPAINAYSKSIITGQNVFGTYGHKYAPKWRDGSPNGPMRNLYGTVNNTSMPGWLGLLLTKECGVINPDLDPAIERASRFYSYYSGKGTIPYGEHDAAFWGHENNGKSGLAALCYELESHRAVPQKFFSKMAVASTSERDQGHTGPYFNHVWAPLGAAAGGEAAAASHFSRIRWMLDLNRRWNGLFISNRYGEDSEYDSYSDFRMSTPALLTYALPLRQLHITGRGHDPLRWLTTQDVAEAEAVDAYNPTPRSTSALMMDLGSWSPKVQRIAAMQLGQRPTETTALLPTLHAMATDPQGTSRVGATFALGYIGHTSSAGILAALLTDPVNHVRLAAAEGLREMSQSIRAPHLNTVLAAAAANAAPLLPFNEEDPAHLTHSRIGPLLFDSGGMVPSNLAGVDRNLLYPAIRAVARNPVGYCRSSLARIYDNLNQTDYLALADTVVYSAYELTPADKMFAYGDRFSAQKLLERFNAAEGVPLCLLAIKDSMYGSVNADALTTLQLYAGSSKTVVPDPDVEGAMNFLIQTGTNATEAQAVLAAIAADPNPVTLQPLKSIQPATADAPALTLPAKMTTLRVTANDLAKGDSIYTWRKIRGAGKVTFLPNGTSVAKDSVVLFDGPPGQYLFEVKMSDSRNLTEVYSTVAVTLNQAGGTLPPNSPPVANNQSPSVPQETATPIILTASDPEGYALDYRLTSQPTHGQLTGTAPYLVYTSDPGYTGSDSFTFEVSDSEGQVSTATVNLTVTAISIPPTLQALAGNGTTGNLMEWAGEADGYRFQTGASALAVKWLGIHDAPNVGAGTVGDGLQASHRVSIWRESDGALMAQTTVLTTDALVGSFRRHDIPLVTLAANTGYVIAADYGANGDRLMENANQAEWGVHSGISNLAGRYGGAGGGMPPNGYSLMIGPNFGYTQVPNDNVSPIPNPMAFHQAPTTASLSSISMVAVTAFDPSDVEYYFTSTAGGGDHSGWQDSPSYTDTGLTPGVSYSYTVKARDKSPAQNQTTASPIASATISTQAFLPNMAGLQQTQAQAVITTIGMSLGTVTTVANSGLSAGTVIAQSPSGDQNHPLGTTIALTVSSGDSIAPTPNPASFANSPVALNSSSITMTATTATDASGVDYFFDETSGNPGGTDSGWQSSPSYSDTGLSPSTSYTYTVTVRDKSAALNATAASAPASATTSVLTISTVWNVNVGDGSVPITTDDNYIGAATESAPNPGTGLRTWNSVTNTNLATLADSKGSSTAGVTFKITPAAGSAIDFGSAGLNTGDKIFRTWIKDNGNNDLFDITFGNLDPTYSYDLVIYSDWHWANGDPLPVTQTAGAGLTGAFVINRDVTNAGNGNVGPLLQDTNPADVAAGKANFARFTGLTVNPSNKLSFSMGAVNGPVSGFQLIKATALPVQGQIISFGIPGSPGIIDQTANTISLTVPYVTNLATLAPAFTLSSGTCNQTSGSPPSPTFAVSNPATYTVTAVSGVTNAYSVAVTVAPLPPFMALTGDYGAPAAYDSSGYGDELDGYKFTVGASNLTVNWLGWYDAANGGGGAIGDGFLAAKEIGLWETSSGTLLAQTTLAAGTTGTTMSGSFRGQNITTPVVLTAGTTYTIAGHPGGGDIIHEVGSTGSFTVNGVTMLGGVYDYSWPTMPASGWSFLIGPNFGATAPATPDTTAPTPSTMTWASPPAASSFSSITMTATTATDPSGVEYFFDETSGNPGGTDSGWQNSPTYTDTGLSASTAYTYTVKARDKSAALNQTLASTPASATTSVAPLFTVWNIQFADQAGNQITTADNFIGAATENTANSTWNRVASVPQTAMALKKSDATNTGVTLDYIGGAIGTQNLTSGAKIFNSRVGGSITMTLKGLTVANSYDLVIYSDWWWKDGDSLPITQTIGTGLVGTFYLNRVLSGTYGTVLALTRDTNPANVTSGAGNTGNWMRVNGLAPTLAGELAFRLTDGNNTPFNGFQLIATPIAPKADMLGLSLASSPPSIKDAVFSGTNVTLTVPFGTNVTSVAPTYVLWPGATCTTSSGTARNFTTPQTYTVTSSDSLVTKNYIVTVVIAPPLPEFTLSAPANWNGRSTITVQPVISNLALLQANNGTNFTYNWSASNVAVTQTTSPGIMTLTRSQGSGSLLVTLTLNNGTENVTRSTTITVQEPATDPWVERTPLANEKPIAGQFFARNPFTNLGTIYYRGTQSGTPNDVFLKVYRTPSGGSESLYATIRQALTGGAYNFTAPIDAGLFTYRVVYGTRTTGIDTDVTTVNNLLCGDAFIIEGQSNAQATDTGTAQVDTSAPWVKTYDASLGWGPAYARPTSPNWGSKVGFWGMKLAQDIVAQQSMPVCLINGAVGGTYIAQHQPNPANRTVGAGTYDIYANLLNRVIAARLTHGIRGVFWHQGESDASTFGPPLEADYLSYEQNFLSMSSAWKQDYPNFQRYIMFQIAPNPCGIGPFASEIREVQRQLPRLYSNMSMVNTIAVPGYEGCHYTEAGYANLAARVLPVVKRDFYGVTYSAAVTPPNLVRAYFTSGARTAIALQFDQPMSWSSFSLPNWHVNDVANQVTSGSASGNKITLQLSSAASANSTLDYVKDTWNYTESVTTLLFGANAIPALTFANVSIGTLTPYEAWTGSKNLSGLAVAGDADPDNDGVKNALEFVLGGEPNPANPGSNSATLLPTSSRNPSGDLVSTFKRKLESLGNVNFTFQWSNNLTFPPLNTVPIGATGSTTDGITVVISTFDAATHSITVTVPASKAAGGKLFGRLQAITP